MKTEETLELHPIDLKWQKVISLETGELSLRDNSIRFRLEFWAKEPKREAGSDEVVLQNEDNWEQVYNSFDVTARKDLIAGVECCYLQTEDIWKVIIYIMGFPSDIKIYYNQQAEAAQMAHRLNRYLYVDE